MTKDCSVCGRVLKSEKSKALGMGPTCARKVAEKFGKGKHLPAPNQSSIFTQKEIFEHYENNLAATEKILEGSDDQKTIDFVISIRETFEEHKNKKHFRDWLETQYIYGNMSFEVIKKYSISVKK